MKNNRPEYDHDDGDENRPYYDDKQVGRKSAFHGSLTSSNEKELSHRWRERVWQTL